MKYAILLLFSVTVMAGEAAKTDKSAGSQADAKSEGISVNADECVGGGCYHQVNDRPATECPRCEKKVVDWMMENGKGEPPTPDSTATK